MTPQKLNELKKRFGIENEFKIYDKHFLSVAGADLALAESRYMPYSGMPTFLNAPFIDLDNNPETNLDVALYGVPMDLGVSNRSGARFGPRALRYIERIGPYNHVLKNTPANDLKVADIGDVPFNSRFDLIKSHQDIEKFVENLVRRNIIPLAVGGDHSITLPILRALGKQKPVALVHIDAHCDTSGICDDCRFYHGGPFRHAVLEGVLNPEKTIQIGIRGSSEFLWEFSYESGMTVIHAEDIQDKGVNFVIDKTRELIGSDEVYISFDIDGLDPAFAPGTGTPEIGGLTTREAQAILRGLTGMNIIGGDVVEVAPNYDTTTNTIHAGAQMLFEILSLIALNKKHY